MALESPGEERDDDYFRQGLEVASSATSPGGAGGELGAAVGNMNITRVRERGEIRGAPEQYDSSSSSTAASSRSKQQKQTVVVMLYVL